MTRVGSIQSNGKRLMDVSMDNDGQVKVSVLVGKGQGKHEEFIDLNDVLAQIEDLIKKNVG